MPVHLVAYRSAILGSEQPLSAITDGVLPMRSGVSRLVPPSNLYLVAACATAVDLSNARVYTDSMRPFGYNYIRPLNLGSLLFGDNPRLQVLFDSPIAIRGSEEIRVDISHGGGSQDVLCLLWLADELIPISSGMKTRWIRYSAAAQAPTPDAWSRVTNLSVDQSLPVGTYAVLGLEHFSTTAQAARLVFANQSARPGVMALSGASVATNRNHSAFYDGSFGVMGYFHSSALPGIEVLCTGIDTTPEGYMRVAQVG